MRESDNNSNEKRHTGATNLYLTLLRKNRDKVTLALSTGENHIGIIDAFDEGGVILRIANNQEEFAKQVFFNRSHIVQIVPLLPVSYLNTN